MTEETLSNLLHEERRFEPPAEIAEHANLTAEAYERAASDREGFWAEQAERLSWETRWDQVLEYAVADAQGRVQQRSLERLTFYMADPVPQAETAGLALDRDPILHQTTDPTRRRPRPCWPACLALSRMPPSGSGRSC